MELIEFDADRLARLSRQCGQVRDLFASLMQYLPALAEDDFPVKGITARLADDRECIHVQYRSIGIDLVLTQLRVDGTSKGKVTAMLVKHPLLAKPHSLGSFTFDRTGITDLQNTGDFDTAIGSLGVPVVMTFLEKAVYLDAVPAQS
ncbi:hypothetical protein ASC95_01280 [Pelomonas sp. Root1217]|uniref:hypothetical protein n=1 Tax=Pelomonas sp. Root1217 TaxID=1736430 RepID=UPI00070FEDBA|nr:hypothetical protein [Pelomonas sp. Root1217]KQV60139.1 hypothetical protein ASC95_01280 [Pelomonas sp. Root1217]